MVEDSHHEPDLIQSIPSLFNENVFKVPNRELYKRKNVALQSEQASFVLPRIKSSVNESILNTMVLKDLKKKAAIILQLPQNKEDPQKLENLLSGLGNQRESSNLNITISAATE